MKRYLLIALVLFSCKKDASTTNPPANNEPEKVSVRLSLDGELSRSGTDLKTIYDSTVYAVSIKTLTGTLFAQGLFDNTDSLKFELYRDSSYNVYVAAIRKGSSQGLWWELSSDSYRQYAAPIQGKLQNKTIYTGLQAGFLDSLSFMKVLTDTVTRASNTYRYPELDTYYGMTNYTARDTNNTHVSILLKRMVFAVSYDVHNLTAGGYVKVDYGGLAAPDTLRANDTLPKRIYTGNAFKTLDNSVTVSLPVTLTWVKANGTTEALGTKTLSAKRNTITYISVYLNTYPGQVTPVFTLDNSPFEGTDDVDF